MVVLFLAFFFGGDGGGVWPTHLEFPALEGVFFSPMIPDWFGSWL